MGGIAQRKRTQAEWCRCRSRETDRRRKLLGRRTRMPRAKATVARGKWRRRVAQVKTDSTHPPAGLFTKDPATIARVLASRKISPKGPGSGMRMLTYCINRAGEGLSKERRAKLERAKELLAKRTRGTSRQRRRRHAKAG